MTTPSPTRRTALTGGLTIVGAAALTACGDVGNATEVLGVSGSSRSGIAAVEPKILKSSGGRLTVNLEAKPAIAKIAGRSVKAHTYSGALPGPTWLVSPGDRITVNFTNRLSEPTNLHTHGFHVSPQSNSDNVFVEIAPGASFKYEYQLPANHPLGTFWYHPHHHGMAAEQVFSGLYGAIVVQGKSPTPVDAERVMVLSDISFDGNGNILGPSMMARMMGREGSTLLVNGQVQPVFASKKNSIERWRIVNAATSRYFHLHWVGAKAQLVGIDSGTLDSPMVVNELTLAPGNRAELLVTIADGAVKVLYDNVAHPDMGIAAGSEYKNYILATFNPGASSGKGLSVPLKVSKQRNLKYASITAKRSFTLAMPAMGGGMMMSSGAGFTINGHSFDMNTVNTTVSFGATEEWTIRNTTNMHHPFHLHVWPMQLISVSGVSVTETRWQDVVNVPPKSTAVVRIAFEDFKGMAVYHCHILDHEDLGMMGIIEVV